MDESEREGFKEQLRVMAAGRGDGIDLDTKERWVIEGLEDAAAFFRELSQLVPEDSILYFEGTNLAEEVVRFYESNRAKNAVCVVRDIIFPAPDIFHVALGPGVLERMSELVERYPLEKCFFHVKAYREGKMLFTFHDAFDGSSLLIVERIEEARVHEFSNVLGAKYSREENVNNRDPELLRLLWAMENPDKVKIRAQGERPWWKKLLFWKK